MEKLVKEKINKVIKEIGVQDQVTEAMVKTLVFEKLRNQKQLEIEKKSNNNQSVKKIYKHITDISLNKDIFSLEVKETRKKLGIPKNGFSLKNKSGFKEWSNKYSTDDYKLLSEIFNSNKILKTNPVPLIRYLSLLDFDIEWYQESYFNDKRFILHCPSIEIFQNHCIEKPFIGVLEYVLFNKIVIPNTRLMSIIEDDGGGRGEYILLGISKNTTKRDILDQWPAISLEQREILGGEKGKLKTGKNNSLELKMYKYEKETERFIKEKKLKGRDLRNYKSRRLYDSIDEDFVVDSDKKNILKRRQIKNRLKKKIK